MARNLQKLSDTKARSEKLKPGRYSDGGGLYLVVTAKGGKSWAFLWKKPGAKWNTEMGLGSYPDVSLAKARGKAQDCRELVADGRDPIAERKKEAEPTFGECADKLVASMSPSWRNAKHRAQWTMTLTEYCKPIREKKVSLVGTDDVLSVLKPIWQEKPETASRLRGRIERVLNFAKAKGWRSGENPAIWRGHLKDLLPAPAKLSKGHHPAMPYKDLPAFFVRLRASKALSALALEFAILTAARTGETLGMEWPEIDFEAKVWTVPGERMKAGKEHRVPLSPRALEIVTDLFDLRSSLYVFPGQGTGKRSNRGRPLSNMSFTMLLRRLELGHFTPHGFRSSFRDWTGDETSFAREVAEAALAHKVGDDTEQAYRRSDALAKRRRLMDAWARFCASKPAGKVLQMFPVAG